MKTAGDILSAIFDQRFVEKAQGYSKLFDSWVDITAKNGIAAAADHSRIKDLDRGILLVEMDHPGWKQILQTKQSKLLNDFRYRFPEMEISGISLILGKGSESNEPQAEPQKEPTTPTDAVTPPISPPKSLDDIEDEDFKQTLKSLGQSIADRDKLLK